MVSLCSAPCCHHVVTEGSSALEDDTTLPPCGWNIRHVSTVFFSFFIRIWRKFCCFSLFNRLFIIDFLILFSCKQISLFHVQLTNWTLCLESALYKVFTAHSSVWSAASDHQIPRKPHNENNNEFTDLFLPHGETHWSFIQLVVIQRKTSI